VKNSPYLDRPLRSEAQARHEIELRRSLDRLNWRATKIAILRGKLR
jgi:hypothetical protein